MPLGRRRLIGTLISPALLFAFALLNGSCGSSFTNTTPTSGPTQPSDVPNLAGAWTGTLESSAFATKDIAAQIVQTGVDCVDGAWQTTVPGLNGAISGFAKSASSFDGFVSVEGSPSGSGLCLGVFHATGSATATGIKWTWVNDGNCAGGIQQTVTFKLHKS